MGSDSLFCSHMMLPALNKEISGLSQVMQYIDNIQSRVNGNRFEIAHRRTDESPVSCFQAKTSRRRVCSGCCLYIACLEILLNSLRLILVNIIRE